MIRFTLTTLTVASLLILGACSSEQRTASTNDGYQARQVRTDADSRGYSTSDSVAQGSQSNRSTWGNQGWNDSDSTMINNTELPAGARTSLNREADGSTLTEISRGTWDGRQVYCGKVMKYGHPYKVITDADGGLLAMRRLD